jgi:hypothetical protein
MIGAGDIRLKKGIRSKTQGCGQKSALIGATGKISGE